MKNDIISKKKPDIFSELKKKHLYVSYYDKNEILYLFLFKSFELLENEIS